MNPSEPILVSLVYDPEEYVWDVARMKRNRYISGVEMRFVQILHVCFRKVDVQVRVHGQTIDAYIPELDVYVQLDGTYWHGLDESKDRNRRVLKKMAKDLKLNGFFSGAKSGPKLFRINDQQWIFAEENGSAANVIEALKAAPPGLTLFDGPPGYRLGNKG